MKLATLGALLLTLNLGGCAYWQAVTNVPTPKTAEQVLADVRVEFANLQEVINLYALQPPCTPAVTTACSDDRIVIPVAKAEDDANTKINQADVLIQAASDKSLTSAGALAAQQALAALKAELIKDGVAK